MFNQNYSMAEKIGFDQFINSLGRRVYSYGNATHAFADILLFLSANCNGSPLKILMPSFIPAKLYRIILAYGWQPVFYEINENCEFNLEEIDEMIEQGTRAIFVIHYFGRPANIQPLRELSDEKNLILIEDCAHVIQGTDGNLQLGEWGDFAIFSPRKMLNLPEGGYLVLNKEFENFKPSYKKRVNGIYTFSKLLQSRGKSFYLNITKGIDVFGVSKIPERGYIDFTRNGKTEIKNISLLSLAYSKAVNIEDHIRKRQRNYTYLFNNLRGCKILKPLYYELPLNWTPYSFPVIVRESFRDLLQAELNKNGISSGAGWPESPFENHLDKTFCLAKNLIEFPVHPYLNEHQLKKIIEVCKTFERKISVRQNYPGAEWFSELISNTPQSEIIKKESDIKIRMGIIKSDEEFDNLGDEWVELCEKSNTHIFQTFEWQRLWWKYYGKDKELNLLVFYSINYSGEEKLVGIAPFFTDVTFINGFKLLKRLKLLGSGIDKDNKNKIIPEYSVSDYLDFIIQPGYEKEVAKIFIKHLKKNYKQFDIIQLDEVRLDSVIFQSLIPVIKDLKWKYKIERKEICPKVNLPLNINEFFKQLSPNIRYRFRKTKKDIINNFNFLLKKAATYQFKEMWDDLVYLHQKRWNKRGLPGLFSSDNYKNFLEEVTHTFIKKGYLYLTGIYSGAQCISSEYAFKYKNNFYDYLKGFDDNPEFAKYRPGKALLFLLIEDALESDCKVVDLLRGAEQYKFEIANDWHYVYSITVINPLSKNYISYSLFKLTRNLIYIKYFLSKETNIILSQIKNNGIKNFVQRYISDLISRVERKTSPPVIAAQKRTVKKIRKKPSSYPEIVNEEKEKIDVEG